MSAIPTVELEGPCLSYDLTKRGIGPAAAAELVEQHSRGRVQTMISLHTWHNARGEEKGPGILG